MLISVFSLCPENITSVSTRGLDLLAMIHHVELLIIVMDLLHEQVMI